MEEGRHKKKISLFLLFRVFLRSFFIQAVWNFECLLGFGLAYAMIPVIRRLYPGKEERKLVTREYLSFFNTHPYLAAPIIGVLISEEEKNAALKGGDRTKIQNLKIQIMGPLGALGDTFCWATLRPFAALLGVSFVFLFWDKSKFTALTGGLLSFFCFYNFFHIVIRFVGILQGYDLGIQIVGMLKKINLQKFIRILSSIGVIIIGIGLAIFCFSCSLFNLAGLLNFEALFNFFAGLTIFAVVSLFLLRLTPAKIILILILFGQLLTFYSG